MMGPWSRDGWATGMGLLLIACIITLSSSLLSGVDGACSASEYQCVYQNVCIPETKRFNGVNDCYDNSDEAVGTWCEKVNSFKCNTSGSCIPINYRNDGDRDCSDGSDEGKIIGSFCNTSWCCPCDMFIDNSYCDVAVSRCACKPGYYSNPLLSDCIARIVGDPCSAAADCSSVLPHGSCINGACGCVNGYYVTNNKTVCTPRVLGDNCTVDTDCSGAMEGSLCKNGVCACHVDWFDYDNGTACWHLLLGDSCSRDSLCYAGIKHAYCKSGTCNCRDGYLWKGNVLDVCYNRLIGVDYCGPTSECGVANSACGAGNVCLCTTKYSVTPDKYWCTTRGINENCTGDDQCAGLSNAYCNTAGGKMLCACTSGYKASPQLDACLNNHVGDPCGANSDCSNGFVGGYCTAQKVCACIAGYLTTTTKVCRPRRIGIDSCATDVDCYGGVVNSICVAGLCSCVGGFTVSALSNTTCVVNVLSKTPCAQDSHCSRYAQSICVAGVCSCGSGYTIGTLNCTELRIGDKCSQSSDCSWVSNSTCDSVSGVCQCVTGYVLGAITTCRRRVLGSDPCTTDADCSTGVANSVCAANNTCICGPGYETTSDFAFCLDPSASTQGCNDFARCKPWAIVLILAALLLPPIVTGVVMLTYKNFQQRKTRLKQSKKEKYGKPDPYRDLGMAAIPTITNFTAPHDTALHTLPEIGAEWSDFDNDETYFTSTPKDTAGLVIRDKSFFRDITSITSITSKFGSNDDILMTKVEL